MPFRAKALKIVIKELEQSTSPTSADGPVADDEDGEVGSSSHSYASLNQKSQDGDGWEDDEAAEAAREALDISREQRLQRISNNLTASPRFPRRGRFIPPR